MNLITSVLLWQNQSSSNSGWTIGASNVVNSFLTLLFLIMRSQLLIYLFTVYCDHLDKMHFDMTTRCADLINLSIPTQVSQPMLNTQYEDLGVVQEVLICLKNNFEQHSMISVSFQAFWLQNDIPESYPAFHNIVKKFYIAFPTSY